MKSTATFLIFNMLFPFSVKSLNIQIKEKKSEWCKFGWNYYIPQNTEVTKRKSYCSRTRPT